MLEAIDRQRGALFLWAPVFFAAGIGGYFALKTEPDAPLWALVAALALAGAAAAWRWPGAAPLGWALMLTMAGLGTGGMRTLSVTAPVLEGRYYGPVEGRIVALDRSASDKLRLTLDRVVLSNRAPERVPGRVRVALHGHQGFIDPVPGMVVILTGHLSPPEGPVEPGGFDFQRQAWFRGLGAVGYTRTPVLMLEPAPPGFSLARWRLSVARAIRAAMPADTGPFAAAIVTGDRSEIARDVLDDLRASNLAHLLAISGLHMGLLTGVVFVGLRAAAALVPRIALRWPVKKIAAAVAVLAGAVYLALSGGAVATMRAFVMVAVMFAAVLLDRRAITLRAVALAALIVLALRPEELLSPGFQMSFAATTALVAVFGAVQGLPARWRHALPRYVRPVLAVILSSAVAGAATAPFAAAHFNQVPHYGLAANLLSVPVMGSVIMPAAVLTALLAPLGLAGIGFWIMDKGIGWIVAVAGQIADWPGALSFVPAPPGAVLPMVALGAIFAVAWQGRARGLGALPVAAAFALWAGADRPDILIAPRGDLIGLMAAEGRLLSKARGGGFVARSWLENDGDPAAQAEAFDRPGRAGERGYQRLDAAGFRLAHVTGTSAGRHIAAACVGADLVVLSEPGVAAPCAVIGPDRLRDSGAIAIRLRAGGPEMTTVREVSGLRPWNRAAFQ